jgi:EAL domain-containing protein (putative c-di-GMP-specific phosphodiesterase class I)
MEDPEATARLLRQLRDSRIQTHLDDFGTDYSSLSYLHRFPMSTLKVDCSPGPAPGGTERP